jgi:L-seryl-tRNA(Ser) seleniumtransferase
MAAGGARLVEVGTTNRTYLEDYRAAADAEAAMLLRVHTSNYRLSGFVHSVPLAELVALGHDLGLPVVEDLGSGSLLDTRRWGLAAEPLVTDSVAAGVDLVTFSGDKLLGGPQAGLVVGRRDLVARVRAHPLTRALRPGKETLAGLAATLQHYLRGEAETAVPVWRMIALDGGELAARARALAADLSGRGAAVELVPGESTVGGGSLPGEVLPTTLVAIGGGDPERLAALLRTGEPPVVARVAGGRLLLDLRTVDEAQLAPLAAAVAGALARTGVLG